MDLFRQQSASDVDKTLKLLLRRLVRIRSRFENSIPAQNQKNRLGLAAYVTGKMGGVFFGVILF
jgi:hypothetical protein